MKNESSVLLALFKRKGGEGFLTKIVADENNVDNFDQLSFLSKDEKPLLCFKGDSLNWLLLTDKRIAGEQDGVKISIPFSELIEAKLAIQEEFRNSVTNKEEFTRLSIKVRDGNSYILKVEKGAPYRGIYQVLHHVASKNQ